VQPEETQAKPKAQNALHDPTVAGPREEVQREAVLERCREGRVLVLVAPYGDAGKNLLCARILVLSIRYRIILSL